MLFGETLITHELVKQLQDLNEVLALSALLNEEKIKGKILQRLRSIAFPEDIELWNVQIVEAVTANENGNTKDRIHVIVHAYTKGVGGCYDM